MIDKIMELIKKARLFLAGKKTYLACFGIIIEAIIEWTADGDLGNLFNKVMTATAGVSIKAGLNRDK